MSYSFTHYFNDSGIRSVTIGYGDFRQTGYYDAYKDGSWSLDGFNGPSPPLYFTADNAQGFEFYRWTYRLGSTTGTLYYSYENPFIYTGTQNIYIRAESQEETGGGDSSSWKLVTKSLGTVNSTYTSYFNIPQYTLYRLSVTFSNSGTATFYSTGSLDTVGYWGASTSWDSIDGFPSDYDENRYDDDSGNDRNFQLKITVKAGTTYYLWFSSYRGAVSGSSYINIVPPSREWDFNFSSSSSSVSTIIERPYDIKEYTLYLLVRKFKYSGTATFYSTGSLDTVGYFGLTEDYDSSAGKPTEYTKFDDNSGDGNNFRIEAEVEAGKWYYFWFRCYNGGSTGACTIYIDPPRWVLNTTSLGVINTAAEKPFYLNESTLYRLSVTFSNSGTATFYSTGSLDTVGYLGTSTGWDSVDGEPLDVDKYDDDSGGSGNFRLEAQVSPNATYYLWFRCWNRISSGSCYIHITPPATATGNWKKVTPYIYIGGSGWKKYTPCININNSWNKATSSTGGFYIHTE